MRLFRELRFLVFTPSTPMSRNRRPSFNSNRPNQRQQPHLVLPEPMALEAPPGANGTSQVDWESMRTVVNQSDPTSMAAAAINAASGGDENPIDAINRAQAFLSNLKASLETGQSAQV